MLVLLHYNFLLLFIIRQRSKTILLTEIIYTDCLHINNGFIKEAAFSAIPSWTTCLASSSNEDIEHEGLRLVSWNNTFSFSLETWLWMISYWFQQILFPRIYWVNGGLAVETGNQRFIIIYTYDSMQMATPCSSWITHEVSLVSIDRVLSSCQYKVGLTLGTLKRRAGSTLTPDPSETRQLPIVFLCVYN